MTYNSNNDDNIFRYSIRTFFPYWPLFLTLLIACLAIAWGYLKYTTPIYEASASLMIKDEEKGVDDSKIMETLNPFDSKKIVENEIEVLKSKDLMNEVVQKLGLYAPVLEEKDLKSVSAYNSSPLKIVVENPNDIAIPTEEPEKIFFEYEDKGGIVRIKGSKYELNKWIEFSPGIRLKFIKNNRVSSANNPLFFYLINPKIITNDLVEELEVNLTNKLSSVVNLTIKDPVPERGEAILDQLIDEYDNRNFQERNELAVNTMSFIEDRIKNVETDLDELENRIEDYRSQEGVIDLSEQGKLYLQDVGNNDKQISELELQLAVLNNVDSYVMSKGNAGGIVPSTLGIEDPILSQLLEKLYNLEIEYEKLKRTTAENNPILTSISNQIDKIRPSIIENVRSQKQNLQARLNRLYSNNSRFNSNLSNLPEKEKNLLEINRRKAVKNNLFTYLLQKREETALTNMQADDNSAIVEKAEASLEPVSPKPFFAYIIALAFALAVGVSFVKGRELLSGKVLYRSEIEKYTDIPIIAELFQVDQKNNRIKFEKPSDFIMIEQFRQLGARLGLYNQKIVGRRILITSGTSGEGKSFVGSNLAYTLAKTNRKVALLDMDFRKANISKIFELGDSHGIVGYLKGEKSLEEITLPGDQHPNLTIIPTGAAVNDYTELLLNGRISELLDLLSNQFDYIIIDSAPITILAEVHLLAELTDQTLFVIRHSHTNKEFVKRLDALPSVQSLENPSIVFNGIKNRGMINTDYGYGYDLKHMMASYAKH